MFYLCYLIHGKRACFKVPELIDHSKIYRPGPGPINMPQLGLAVTTIEVVNKVEGATHSDLGNKLIAVAREFIEQTKAGLPKGVDLTEYNVPEESIAA